MADHKTQSVYGFGRRDRALRWPADLDAHSAEHRVKDIEATLR